MNAHDADELERHLKQLGLELLGARRGLRLFSRQLRRRELITLCFQLEQNCQAGVPLLDGLRELRDSTEQRHLQNLYTQLVECIAGGRTLSEAMQMFPDTFDEVFIHLVRAGEQSGDIAYIFRKTGEAMKWRDEQFAQLCRMLLYPLFLALTMLGTIAFLMLYLVPKLVLFMTNMNQQLPLYTRILILCADWLGNSWHWCLAGITLGTLLFTLVLHNSPGVRLHIDRLVLELPLLGPLLKKTSLARISMFFAMMYAAGITILDCLASSRQLVSNRAIQRAIGQVCEQVSEGSTLSDGFRVNGLFPPLFIRLIQSGERTGTLEDALHNINYFYSRDVREATERLQTLIEPSLTLVMGGLIGWVMFSVLAPVYDLISTLSI